MSREKQIDEMARIIGYCESTIHLDIECHNKATGCYCIENPCHNQRIADKLHNAGYRKQEWISVDERLPSEFVSVLGYMTDAGDFPPVRECYLVGKVFFFPALKDRHPVSHWMPLPEPPKMKEDDRK